MGRVSRRQALIGAGAAGLLAATPGRAAPPPGGPRVEHYATPPGSERVTAVRRVKGAPYKFTTVYVLQLPDLRAGDVVQAAAQLSVTNDLGFNVFVAHALLAHPKKTVVRHGAKPGGLIVCEYAGENVTPDMHHGFRTLAGSFTAADPGDVWLSLLVYAAAESPKAGDDVRIEKGNGGLRAVVFRNPG
jgi:hypothetical protein